MIEENGQGHPGATGGGSIGSTPSGSPRSTFLVSFAIAFAALVLWAVANPMFASPDEPSHIVRSESIVRFQLDDRIMTTIPVPDGPPCFSLIPVSKWTADCLDLEPSPTERSVVNPAGNYPPLAHVVYGIPSLFIGGTGGLYAMRVMGALVCALALATAVTILASRWSRFVAASVVLIAVTPQVMLVASSVNPSGIAITLALALGAAVLVAAEPTGLDSKLVRWTILVTLVALPLVRRDTVIWVVVLLGVLAMAVGPRTTMELLRRRTIQVALGAFVVASLLARVAFVGRGDLTSVAATTTRFSTGVVMDANLLWVLLRGTMGDLGWLDTQIPMVAMVLGFVVIGTTLFVGLGLTSGWPRYAVLSGIAVSIALAAASTYQRWPYVQGRYLLPVLVVVVVIAGLQIDRRSIDRRLVANLLGSLAIAMVVVQVSAFVHDLRRYSVGPNGPMFPGSEAVWQPPLLSVRGFDLLFAAVGAVAVVALLLCRRDVVPRAGTDGGVALVPNVATALGREG